jgi:hypothetical protein
LKCSVFVGDGSRVREGVVSACRFDLKVFWSTFSLGDRAENCTWGWAGVKSRLKRGCAFPKAFLAPTVLAAEFLAPTCLACPTEKRPFPEKATEPSFA